MKISRISLALLPALALLLAACEDSPVNPLTDSMSATVGGAAWSTVVASGVSTNGITAVTGTRSITSASDVIVIQFPTPTATGSVLLGGVTTASGQYRRDSINYSTTPLSLSSTGTVTISELANGRIGGTFNFTAYRNGDPTTGDSVVITGGTFSVKLN